MEIVKQTVGYSAVIWRSALGLGNLGQFRSNKNTTSCSRWISSFPVSPKILARSKTKTLSGSRGVSSFGHWDPAEFKPKKAVVLTKVSRYEFEKLRHEHLSEKQLEEELVRRGSNYSLVRNHHNVHKAVEIEVVKALEAAGIETKTVKRFEYNDEVVGWSDMVVTTGGDGTFLMGSSKILNRNKPVIGFNTDPTRSEGHLCLPKHFSFNVKEAVDLLLSGKFRWFFRNRLRITLIGDSSKINQTPLELHNQQLYYPEYRYMDLMSEEETQGDHPLKEEASVGHPTIRTLPILALNEIYIGESLSSRVSYLEIQMDNEQIFKTRNSGLCIATGTGSTSWIFNINKLTHHAVETLLKVTFETTRFPLNWKDRRLVESITQKFNNQIVFDPESPVMCYTLRDPISVGTFPSPTEIVPRGKAKKISVKSKCFDACLVVDGSLSYKFNDGTKAIVEILEEDALRTVQLYSCDM